MGGKQGGTWEDLLGIVEVGWLGRVGAVELRSRLGDARMALDFLA